MTETDKRSPQFIPFDEKGKQAYRVDTRPLKIKIVMWFWEHIGIPLMGRSYKGKRFVLEDITGEKLKYVNCNFIRCKFSNLRLFYLLDSYVEYETPTPEFSNLTMAKVHNIAFKKVPSIIKE